MIPVGGDIFLTQANPSEAIKDSETIAEHFFGYGFETAGPKSLDCAGGQGRTT